MNRTTIGYLANSHRDLMQVIDIYDQELNVLKDRLTDIAEKNTGADTQKKVAYFESRFIKQAGNLSHLKHVIHQSVTEIGQQAAISGTAYTEDALLSRHNELEQKFLLEETTTNILRKEFYRFAVNGM